MLGRALYIARLVALRKLRVIDVLLVAQLGLTTTIDQAHIGHILSDLTHLRDGTDLIGWLIVVQRVCTVIRAHRSTRLR